jgi:hypothetical protein
MPALISNTGDYWEKSSGTVFIDENIRRETIPYVPYRY